MNVKRYWWTYSSVTENPQAGPRPMTVVSSFWDFYLRYADGIKKLGLHL